MIFFIDSSLSFLSLLAWISLSIVVENKILRLGWGREEASAEQNRGGLSDNPTSCHTHDMAQNGTNGTNWHKLAQMAQNGTNCWHKLAQIGTNWHKWHKMAQNGTNCWHKLAQIGTNGTKWHKMAQTADTNWHKMAQNLKRRSKRRPMVLSWKNRGIPIFCDSINN